MKILGAIFLIILLILPVFPHATAQIYELPPLEVITPENADRLEELARWEGVDNSLVAATFSPDGKMLALALNDGTIQFLSAQTLEPQRTLTGADIVGVFLRFSPDGSRLLLSSYDGHYLLWDVTSGDVIASYFFPFEDVMWSNVDTQLQVVALLYRDNTLELVQLGSGENRLHLEQIDRPPSPQLSPDGSLLMTADDREYIYVWDTITGEMLTTYAPVIDGDLEGMGFSPDGIILWANWHDWFFNRDFDLNQSVIQFWDTATGAKLFKLDVSGAHRRMVFAPTGDLIATAGDTDSLQNVIWLWNLDTGDMIGEIAATGGGAVSFSPDGKLMVKGSGTAPEVVITTTDAGFQRLVYLDLGSGRAVPPVFSPDGRLLLTVDYLVRLWGVPANR